MDHEWILHGNFKETGRCHLDHWDHFRPVITQRIPNSCLPQKGDLRRVRMQLSPIHDKAVRQFTVFLHQILSLSSFMQLRNHVDWSYWNFYFWSKNNPNMMAIWSQWLIIPKYLTNGTKVKYPVSLYNIICFRNTIVKKILWASMKVISVLCNFNTI